MGLCYATTDLLLSARTGPCRSANNRTLKRVQRSTLVTPSVVTQISVCSDNSRASSTSIPR